MKDKSSCLKTMKVAFNSLPLSTGHKVRGIGTYTRNLLSQLQKDHDLQIVEFGKINEVKNAGIVHYPYFDLFKRTLPFRKKYPTVVTIHDVTPLVFPQHYPPGIKGKINYIWQKMSLKGVSAVITDSEASKRDINKYLGVKSTKIHVIYLGVDSAYKYIANSKKLEQYQKKLELPKSFALYVGSVNWNKNLLNLTEACVKTDIDLVVVGKDFQDHNNLDHPEKRDFAKWLKQYSGNSKIHILGYVDDLVGIYNLSEVLLLPSFYEGFGLPILEAQACGIPVVTSKLSSMPEIAGKGALLVDPNNIQDLVDALREIKENKNLKKKLIENGLQNVQKFTWAKCAQEVKNVYKTVSK